MAVPTRGQQTQFKDVLVDALNRAGHVKAAAQVLRSDIVTGDVGGERLVEYLADLVGQHAFFGNLPAGLGTFANGELSNPPADLAAAVTVMRAAMQTVIDTLRAALPSSTVSLDANGAPTWVTFAPGQIGATTLAADLDALIATFE